MIEFRHITITNKNTGRCLLRDFNFVLKPGDRAAIIGEEGDGKSTLLKLAHSPEQTASYCDYSGEVRRGSFQTGYLEQECTPAQLHTPARALFSDLEDWGTLYTCAWELNVEAELLESDRPLALFSGGERLKLRMLRLLAQEPDVILLDEPTNDIDLRALEWMERFLIFSRKPVLYVSHDETLLERTANAIIHLEQVRRKTAPRCTVERTSYTEYVERRLSALQKQEQMARKEHAEYRSKVERWRQIYDRVDHEQASISRGDPHGGRLLKKKMASVKAQERRLNREENVLMEAPDTEDAAAFSFPSVTVPRGKRVLDYSLPILQAGERVLAKGVHLIVTGPEHVGIIGHNGVGKTTLMRLLVQELTARKDIETGVMPQDYSEVLDVTRTPVELLAPSGEKNSVTRAYTFLGSMKYTQEEMEQPCAGLSGGQKAKLLLLRLILQECNVLLLDEPTRNFSPLSNPVLRCALNNYGGAWLAVTHDRKLLEICTVVYELTQEGLMRLW